MAFSVEDFHDLVQLLEQQPAWRGELRRLLLSDEILTLPQLVLQLVEAQQRTEERLVGVEERLGRLEQVVERLAEAQQRTEKRLGRLEQAMERLADAQQGTETRLAPFEQMAVDLGRLKGSDAERRYHERAPAYFRSIVLRAHALSADERATLVEDAVVRGQLTDQEAGDLMLADVLVRGRHREDQREVYLVVEVSWGIGDHDVRRAADRATLLAKVGIVAIPVVAGEWPPQEVADLAQARGVWQVTDGRTLAPQAA